MPIAPKVINFIGLASNFLGVILLVVFSIKATGQSTLADLKESKVIWLLWIGFILVILGFLAQLIVAACPLLSC